MPLFSLNQLAYKYTRNNYRQIVGSTINILVLTERVEILITKKNMLLGSKIHKQVKLECVGQLAMFGSW